jgi:hypothetical protein
MQGNTAMIFGFKVPHWLLELWAWLPWIAAGVAGTVSFVNNLVTLYESKTVRRRFANWHNRRRAKKILALRRKLLEVEAQSEF